MWALLPLSARDVSALDDGEEQILPASQIVATPREVTSVMALIEEAVQVKTNTEKKTVIGATMPLESIINDNLSSIGKSIKVYPKTIYREVVKVIESGEKDKKKIGEILVLLQRTGKLVEKVKPPSVKLRFREGKIIEVIEEVSAK